ncbi:MAG: glycosyltransferase family 4 protein, partial [Nitrospirae bacterium]|nr:glycosyltransferase family 4 protein [Nitrospirota bacterium]
TMNFRGLKKTESVEGINVHRVPCFRAKESVCHPPEMLSYILAAIPRTYTLVKEKGFDLNHTHFIFPDGVVSYVIKKLTGLPYIITIHGSDVPGFNTDRFAYQHKFLGPLWQRVVQSASQIVSPSDSLKRLLHRHCPTAPVVNIPNGLLPNKFSPDVEKTNRILVVSRMFARKGIQYVLQALAKLRSKWKYEVNIVGDGPYLSTLKQVAKDLQVNVKFWGHIDNTSLELKELYETSRIFVCPSESENFPIVLLEAMGAGMAIITTENTGCAEVVGETGILVPSRNAEAIRKGVIRLFQNPELCKNLGQAARKRFEDHFTWDVVTKKYGKVYENFGSMA